MSSKIPHDSPQTFRSTWDAPIGSSSSSEEQPKHSKHSKSSKYSQSTIRSTWDQSPGSSSASSSSEEESKTSRSSTSKDNKQSATKYKSSWASSSEEEATPPPVRKSTSRRPAHADSSEEEDSGEDWGARRSTSSKSQSQNSSAWESAKLWGQKAGTELLRSAITTPETGSAPAWLARTGWNLGKRLYDSYSSSSQSGSTTPTKPSAQSQTTTQQNAQNNAVQQQSAQGNQKPVAQKAQAITWNDLSSDAATALQEELTQGQQKVVNDIVTRAAHQGMTITPEQAQFYSPISLMTGAGGTGYSQNISLEEQAAIVLHKELTAPQQLSQAPVKKQSQQNGTSLIRAPQGGALNRMQPALTTAQKPLTTTSQRSQSSTSAPTLSRPSPNGVSRMQSSQVQQSIVKQPQPVGGFELDDLEDLPLLTLRQPATTPIKPMTSSTTTLSGAFFPPPPTDWAFTQSGRLLPQQQPSGSTTTTTLTPQRAESFNTALSQHLPVTPSTSIATQTQMAQSILRQSMLKILTPQEMPPAIEEVAQGILVRAEHDNIQLSSNSTTAQEFQKTQLEMSRLLAVGTMDLSQSYRSTNLPQPAAQSSLWTAGSQFLSQIIGSPAPQSLPPGTKLWDDTANYNLSQKRIERLIKKIKECPEKATANEIATTWKEVLKCKADLKVALAGVVCRADLQYEARVGMSEDPNRKIDRKAAELCFNLLSWERSRTLVWFETVIADPERPDVITERVKQQREKTVTSMCNSIKIKDTSDGMSVEEFNQQCDALNDRIRDSYKWLRDADKQINAAIHELSLYELGRLSAEMQTQYSDLDERSQFLIQSQLQMRQSSTAWTWA